MNGERGEGRAVRHFDRWLDGQLFDPKSSDLTAPTAAGGKGDHQDREVTQIAQAFARAGCQQPGQNVTSHRFGAFTATRARDGPHGVANGRLEGRRGEGTIEAAPFGQCRPVGQTPTHGGWRVRADRFEKLLPSKVVVNGGWHPVTWIGSLFFRVQR